MKNFGILLILIAIVLFLYAFSMDVTVDVGDGTRVNNIGLMSEQQNYVVMAGFLLIAGILCTRKSGRKKSESDVKKINSTEDVTILRECDGGHCLDEGEIKSLAVYLLNKHPKLSTSDILLVNMPLIEKISRNLPKELSRQFKADLQRFLCEYS